MDVSEHCFFSKHSLVFDWRLKIDFHMGTIFAWFSVHSLNVATMRHIEWKTLHFIISYLKWISSREIALSLIHKWILHQSNNWHWPTLPIKWYQAESMSRLGVLLCSGKMKLKTLLHTHSALQLCVWINWGQEVNLLLEIHHIRLLIRTRLWLIAKKQKYVPLRWDPWASVCIQTHFWKTHSCAVNQAFGISKIIKSHNSISDFIGCILASISWHIIPVCSFFSDGPF